MMTGKADTTHQSDQLLHLMRANGMLGSMLRSMPCLQHDELASTGRHGMQQGRCLPGHHGTRTHYEQAKMHAFCTMLDVVSKAFAALTTMVDPRDIVPGLTPGQLQKSLLDLVVHAERML